LPVRSCAHRERPRLVSAGEPGPRAHELTRRGYEVVVINPIQTKGAFRSRIRTSKTDKPDAVTIAQLVLSDKARAARIPSKRTLELRILSRHRWRLVVVAHKLARITWRLLRDNRPYKARPPKRR
jgi:transposase